MPNDLERLNAQDSLVRSHYARKVRAILERKIERREARALIREARAEYDDLRGDMLRAFLK